MGLNPAVFKLEVFPFYLDGYRDFTNLTGHLIYENMANTSSLTWRGFVMIFEQETCLYVISMLKSYIYEKKFFYFFKMADFFQ